MPFTIRNSNDFSLPLIILNHWQNILKCLLIIYLAEPTTEIYINKKCRPFRKNGTAVYRSMVATPINLFP